MNGDDDTGGSKSENAYHVVTGSGTDATALLDGFTITASRANGSSPDNCGGGLYNNSGSPTLTNCSLSGNSATAYGGAMYNSSSSPTLTNCSLSGNWSDRGGAVYNTSSSPKFTNCSFEGNSAPDGGAMYNFSASPRLTNCSLFGNSASSSGGAIQNQSNSRPKLTNCSISKNSSLNAGAIANCTSSPTLTNCIIWNNPTGYQGQIFNNNSTPIINSCLISIDPLFVDAANGDLGLLPGSPAIDAGDYDAYVSASGPSTDLDGKPRTTDIAIISDSGSGSITYLDIGAYEADDQVPSILSFTHTGDTLDAETLTFEITFSEAVTNFDSSDIIVTTTGSAAGTATVTGSGTTYTIDLSAITGEGSFSIAIAPSSDIIDATGNSIDLAANSTVQDVQRLLTTSLIHYVNEANTTNATAPYDTWATAATNLQDALALAAPSDQVWVAQGTYTPGSARADTFQLKSDVAIYGGFSADSNIETLFSDRDIDPSTNLTILSGDLNGDDDTGGSKSENAYHVVTGSGTTNTALLDGFTIMAGNANGAAPHNNGGGLYNNSGSPTLTNCTLSGNSATLYGGAIRNQNSSSPTLTICTLSGNFAATGGGAMSNFDASSPALTNCSFLENTTNNQGGAIRNSNACAPILNNCSFAGNSADNGGAIYNTASSPTFTNCSFSGNSAARGGAIYNDTSTLLTFTNCSFSGNSAISSGGAFYNTTSTLTLTNCLLTGNWSEYGGAMSNYSTSTPKLINSTLTGNSATIGGGALRNRNSNPVLTNCIVWNNEEAGATDTPSASVSNSNNYTPTYASCIIANSGGSGASWVAALGTDNGGNSNTLFGANLTSANLTGANLRDADLTNADLTSATLTDTDLTGATLTWVSSGGITGAPSALPSNWQLIRGYLMGPGANLSGATLTDAGLAGANLNGATLTNADLTGADLTSVTLTNADLTGATLTGVSSGLITGVPSALPPNWQLIRGYLMGPGANLSGAYLDHAQLSQVNLTGANLNDAFMWNVTLTGANLTGANLNGAYLANTDLINVTLTGVSSGNIQGTPSINGDHPAYNGWRVVKGYLVGPGANLSGADLTDAYLNALNLTGADLSGADLTNTDLTDFDLTDVNLTGAVLTGAILTGVTGNVIVDRLHAAEAQLVDAQAQLASEYTLSEIADLRPGSTMIEVDGDDVVIQMKVEESIDLIDWDEIDETADVTLPASPGKKFFRLGN